MKKFRIVSHSHEYKDPGIAKIVEADTISVEGNQSILLFWRTSDPTWAPRSPFDIEPKHLIAGFEDWSSFEEITDDTTGV